MSEYATQTKDGVAITLSRKEGRVRLQIAAGTRFGSGHVWLTDKEAAQLGTMLLVEASYAEEHQKFTEAQEESS